MIQYHESLRSRAERPPDGIDMFRNDRPEQMEEDAGETTYCKRQKMAEWDRWRIFTQRGVKGYQRKENKVYVCSEVSKDRM